MLHKGTPGRSGSSEGPWAADQRDRVTLLLQVDSVVIWMLPWCPSDLFSPISAVGLTILFYFIIKTQLCLWGLDAVRTSQIGGPGPLGNNCEGKSARRGKKPHTSGWGHPHRIRGLVLTTTVLKPAESRAGSKAGTAERTDRHSIDSRV